MRKKITKKQAQQWADALRSGKYFQTEKVLQNEEGYCCLGVACDIFIPRYDMQKDNNNYIWGYTPKSQLNAPKWLRDINDDLYLKCKDASELQSFNDDGNIYFTSLNDRMGYSFDEIADIIELVYVHKALG